MEQLLAKYVAKIYRLKDEYYTRIAPSGNFEIKEGVTEKLLEEASSSEAGVDFVKETYMEPYAISDISSSKRTRGRILYDDLFLLGYAFDEETIDFGSEE